MIDIATVAVIAFPSATTGAFLAYTFLPRKGEGSPNPCDDACTIERLREDVECERFVKQQWIRTGRALEEKIADLKKQCRRLEAENRDLHIDIAEKAKRLSDAGLQSAGGEA